MFGKYLRKFFAAFTAIFWADKSKILMGIFASFWAVQHIACAYGTDDPCEDCYDSSWDCVPEVAENAFSRIGYSDCENTIADSLEYVRACSAPCDSRVWNENMGCSSGGPEDCRPITKENKINFVRDLMLTCPTEHLEADSSIISFQCGNEFRVPVEEGKRRLKEREEWLKRNSNSVNP